MFTQIHFIYELSTWELEFFFYSQHLDDILMDPMWNDQDKLHVIFDKHYVKPEATSMRWVRNGQELELSFCGPQANGIASILWNVVNASFFSIISFSYLTLSQSSGSFWSLSG